MEQDKEKLAIKQEENIFLDHKEKKNTKSLLTFMLSNENYCVEMQEAKQVIPLRQIAKIPNSPGFIIGAMNFQGDIIIIMDIRYFFKLREIEKTEKQMVIVTDIAGFLTGILVDKITGTVELEEDLIQPALATIDEKLALYVKGQAQIQDNIFALLDLKKILTNEEITNLEKGE
jgi:purine-binding chemotaxis protein CheW